MTDSSASSRTLIGARERPGEDGGATDVVVVACARPGRPLETDLAVLTDDELRRVRGYHHSVDAAAFTTGRATLRRALATLTGERPQTIPLIAVPGRAPRVDGSRIGCSVSHGGDLVLVAVTTNGRIGVDVEPVEQSMSRTELEQMARGVLGLGYSEVAALRSLGDRAAVRAFLTRWTLTEAVLKAVGTGLTLDPSSVVLDLAGPHPILLAAPRIRPSQARQWRLRMLPEAAPLHVAAIATDRPCASLRWTSEITNVRGH